MERRGKHWWRGGLPHRSAHIAGEERRSDDGRAPYWFSFISIPAPLLTSPRWGEEQIRYTNEPIVYRIRTSQRRSPLSPCPRCGSEAGGEGILPPPALCITHNYFVNLFAHQERLSRRARSWALSHCNAVASVSRHQREAVYQPVAQASSLRISGHGSHLTVVERMPARGLEAQATPPMLRGALAVRHDAA